MKRILISAAVLLIAGAFTVIASGASNGPSNPTYKVELDNSFGLVTGEQFKVAGVPAGTISDVSLPPSCTSGKNPADCRALVTVQVNQSGLGAFHKDTFCESRPQSLIGEYFLNCDPGSSGPVLKSGSTIPVTQTQSTIPGDLLQDIMRMPYRQRLALIINELGAGVAGNSQNLQAALQRAVPALTQTDSLLNLLANDSHTLQSLTSSANTLVTALANNSSDVQNFIVKANNAATDTATQQANLRLTFQNLPGFLEQLRPALARLGDAVTANTPALSNLNASAGQIDRLLTDLPPFSHAAQPAINLRPLIQASKTGLPAIAHVLRGASPLLAQLGPFLEQLNPIINWLSLHQQLTADFISTPGYALAAETTGAGGTGHYLRTMSPIGPDFLSLGGNRTLDNRGNVYPPPLWTPSGTPQDLQKGAMPSWDWNNTGGPTSANVGGGPPCWVATPPGSLLGQKNPFPHITAAHYSSK